MHPIVVSRITNEKLAHIPLTSLDHILDSEDKNAVYRSRLAVIATRPTISNDFKADQ